MLFYTIIPVLILLLFLPVNFFVRAEKEEKGAKISLYLYGAVLLFRASCFFGQDGLIIKGKKIKTIPYAELLKPDTKNMYLIKAMRIQKIKVFVQVPLIKTKSILPAFSFLTAAGAVEALSQGKIVYKQQFTLFDQGWEGTLNVSTSIARTIQTILKKVIENGRKQTNTANS